MEDNGGLGTWPSEIPEDPPRRGTVAAGPISIPPKPGEIDAALTAFFEPTSVSWLYVQAVQPELAAELRTSMAAALIAAVEACTGRKL